MKIAIWYNLPSGGGKRALYHHVRSLLEKGHYIEAWCPPTADRTYLPLANMVKEHVVPLEWDIKGTTSLIGNIRKVFNNNVKYSRLKKHSRDCADQINKGGFDILFANTCRFIGAPFIGRYSDIKSVLYLQEPYRIFYESLPRLPWVGMQPMQSISELPSYLMQFLKDYLVIKNARIHLREELSNSMSYDTILANSHFSRESLLRAYGVDSKVCSLGIDTKIFRPKRCKKEAFILTVGALTPFKNIEFIISAVALLPHPRPRLVCVCNSIDQIYLEKMKLIAIKRYVDLVIRYKLSDTELVETYNQALVFAYASRLEPFGYAPLEANACGLPIVAVAEGGIRETVLDGFNGLLVENDIHSMANAILQIIQKPRFAKEIGQNGIEYTRKHWSLEQAGDNIERHLTDASH